MQFGIGHFPTDDAVDPGALAPAEPAALEPLQHAGVARAVHWTPSGNRSVVEAALQRWEAAVAQLHGEA